MYAVRVTGEMMQNDGFKILLCIYAIFMIVLSYMDIKERRMPLLLLLLGIPYVIVCSIFGERNFVLTVTGGTVGILFLIISRWTEEDFGYGDSILILELGILIGFWNVLILAMGAFLMAAVFSTFMMIRKKYTRKSKIPFVPFLTLSFLGGIVVGLY